MGYRQLQIDDEEWDYIIGKEGVKMRSPEGRCTWVRHYELMGITKENYLKVLHETFDADDDKMDLFDVGPSDVKKYICDNLRGKK